MIMSKPKNYFVSISFSFCLIFFLCHSLCSVFTLILQSVFLSSLLSIPPPLSLSLSIWALFIPFSISFFQISISRLYHLFSFLSFITFFLALLHIFQTQRAKMCESKTLVKMHEEDKMTIFTVQTLLLGWKKDSLVENRIQMG